MLKLMYLPSFQFCSNDLSYICFKTRKSTTFGISWNLKYGSNSDNIIYYSVVNIQPFPCSYFFSCFLCSPNFMLLNYFGLIGQVKKNFFRQHYDKG